MTPNPPPTPDSFHSRAFTPIQNPVYLYNDDASFKTTPPARNVLDHRAANPKGVDPRLTSQGNVPPVHDQPIVPYAAQTPWNVWGLLPA